MVLKSQRVQPLFTEPFRFPTNPTHRDMTGETPAVLDEGVRLPDPDPLPPPPLANWREVPMPPRVAALPRDRRGYPIFHTVMPPGGVPEDGKVDFAVLNMTNHIQAGRDGHCAICNTPLDYWLWFLGGPMCVQNRIFGDGPMHEDCARYALRVCPFLTNPLREYRHKESEHAEYQTDPNVLLDKPKRIVLVRTRQARMIADPGQPGKPIHAIARPTSVEWYQTDGTYVCTTRPTRFFQ